MVGCDGRGVLVGAGGTGVFVALTGVCVACAPGWAVAVGTEAVGVGVSG